MDENIIVRTLVAEILATHCTVAAACIEHPHLQEAVERVLAEVQRLDVELEWLLPSQTTELDPRGDGGWPATAEFPQVAGYEVLDVLGRGGVGIVYKARHLRLNRLVALKMLLSGVFASRAELRRFTREAKSEAQLVHPHIVQVYDVGEADGRPYFTMEMIGGGTLARRLAGTPLDAADAAELTATLADAVDFAHRNGIVHRDLKPSNVLLTEEGRPKISDFGLARQFNAETQLTFHGDRIGTPSYMPPEQALGQVDRIGPASDVYALGAILYELLTGRPPFKANSAAETERQVISEEPVAPARLNSQVPRALETVCLMCLRKEPAGRYATAAELAADLRRFLRNEPVRAKPIGPLGRANHWVRRHRGLAAALVAVFALLLMLATGSLVAMFHFRDLGIKERAIARESEERGAALRRSLYSAEMNLCGQAASSPSGISRVHHWLLPWKDSKPDLRGWEWFYLYGLCHHDLYTLPASDDGLCCVAASPDGKQIATAGDDFVIRLFDVQSQKLIRRMEGHDGSVFAVAWNPDGSQLASACWDGTVKTWDVETARELRTFGNQTEPFYSVAWNYDGKQLAAAGRNGSVLIWDAATGKVIQDFQGHTGAVYGVAWHPRENRVASAGMDSSVRIWDLNDPEHPQILEGHTNWVNKVAWHPDGLRLASVSNDETCRIWDTRDGSSVTLGEHTHSLYGVCWSSDGGELAVCGEDRTVRIWNASSGEERAALPGHTAAVTSVCWRDGDRQLVSSSYDGTVKFWSAADREVTVHFDVNGDVTDLAWSPDGRRIAESSGNGPTMLLDPKERDRPIIFGEGWSGLAVGWSANGKLLASSGFDAAVHVWNVESRTEVRTVTGKVESIHSLAWSHRNDAFAAVDQDGCVFVWNADSGAVLRTFDVEGFSCYGVAWSPDGRQLASAWDDGTVRVYSVEAGRQVWGLRLHTEPTESVAWSLDGKSIASAGGDGMIRICDAANGVPRQTLQGHTHAVTRVAWHPDGDRLASASEDCSVRIWDPLTGKLMLSFLDLPSPMTTVAWSPDGRSLAAGSEGGAVTVYDAAAGFKAAGISKSPR